MTLLLTGKKGNPKLNWVNYFRKFSTCTKKCNSKLHECVVWLLRVDWDLWWFYIVKWIFWTGAFFVVGGFWSEDVFPSEGRSGPRISGTRFSLGRSFGTQRQWVTFFPRNSSSWTCCLELVVVNSSSWTRRRKLVVVNLSSSDPPKPPWGPPTTPQGSWGTKNGRNALSPVHYW